MADGGSCGRGADVSGKAFYSRVLVMHLKKAGCNWCVCVYISFSFLLYLFLKEVWEGLLVGIDKLISACGAMAFQNIMYVVYISPFLVLFLFFCRVPGRTCDCVPRLWLLEHVPHPIWLQRRRVQPAGGGHGHPVGDPSQRIGVLVPQREDQPEFEEVGSGRCAAF